MQNIYKTNMRKLYFRKEMDKEKQRKYKTKQ